jgi:hypothetical protein
VIRQEVVDVRAMEQWIEWLPVTKREVRCRWGCDVGGTALHPPTQLFGVGQGGEVIYGHDLALQRELSL